MRAEEMERADDSILKIYERSCVKGSGNGREEREGQGEDGCQSHRMGLVLVIRVGLGLG